MRKAYTYEELEALAKKCKTIKCLSDTHNGAYQVIKKNKKFKKIHQSLISSKSNYSFNDLLKITKRYTRRVDFQNNHEAEYMFALRRKWVDKLCKHMPIIMNTFSEQDLKNEISKYKYLIDFKNKSPLHYSACQRKGLLDKIASKLIRSNRKPYSLKQLKEISKKYGTSKEWRESEDSGAYSSAKNKGVIHQLTKHMTLASIKYTDECLRKIALKYRRRIDFSQKDSGAYSSARVRGLLPKICKHMVHEHKQEEAIDQKKVMKILRNTFPKIEFIEQYPIRQEKSKGRIDIFFTLPNGYSMGVELKSDRRGWSSKVLKSQIAKYNYYLHKKHPKYLGTELASLKGRYGVNMNELIDKIKQYQKKF